MRHLVFADFYVRRKYSYLPGCEASSQKMISSDADIVRCSYRQMLISSDADISNANNDIFKFQGCNLQSMQSSEDPISRKCNLRGCQWLMAEKAHVVAWVGGPVWLPSTSPLAVQLVKHQLLPPSGCRPKWVLDTVRADVAALEAVRTATYGPSSRAASNRNLGGYEPNPAATRPHCGLLSPGSSGQNAMFKTCNTITFSG